MGPEPTDTSEGKLMTRVYWIGWFSHPDISAINMSVFRLDKREELRKCTVAKC